MKRILTFALIFAGGMGFAHGAVRDGNATTRGGAATLTQARVATTPVKSVSERGGATGRSAATTTRTNATTGRAATTPTTTVRSATPRAAITSPTTNASRAAIARGGDTTTIAPARGASTATTARSATVARAAADAAQSGGMAETRTGAAYEQCKNAYFTCMDQFCKLKNDDYRRCSCSDRVYDLTETRDIMQEAGERLTVFTENLDTVGMTAAQATAMRTESEGEKALTSDKSASKSLLQAIMNSIKGEDTNVGGKFSDLNTINLSFDTSGAFGNMDAGATIATYNGANLYNAVYPQCRQAVRADCNDASLQRAVTAYLMAVEQDCNAVQTAIESKQKTMKAAVRESSAMLDLARVENRQKHNSDNNATCLANVESAILSPEVCGPGYRKCLDNGEFIDITTGSPIEGVTNFAELEHMLTFASNVDSADQKLSKIQENQEFVSNFVKRVKKFAQPALDKCTEQADVVWDEYLDKALLDIYYAQKSKVAEIKQGCFDFISNCYSNADKALTAAMAELTGDAGIVLQPNKVALTSQMCTDYIESCGNMFGNIIQDYVDTQKDSDVLSACRAAVKQCFDKFGGSAYQNFYYPHSGLFAEGQAADWFTLYDYSTKAPANDKGQVYAYKSQCAKQLTSIDACNDPAIIEKAFGGLDYIPVNKSDITKPTYDPNATTHYYGLLKNVWKSDEENAAEQVSYPIASTSGEEVKQRYLRSTGVATEIYNQVVDILSTQCQALQGRFIEFQFVNSSLYDPNNMCESKFGKASSSDSAPLSQYQSLVELYRVGHKENMCPRDYSSTVDTKSWGICSCWENGARRSKNGTSPKCMNVLPFHLSTNTKFTDDVSCILNGTVYQEPDTNYYPGKTKNDEDKDPGIWCTQPVVSTLNQVCPIPKTRSGSAKLIPDNYPYTGYCITTYSSNAQNPYGTDTAIPKGI